jgi:muramoyltetrapeptide carboxypeptidase
MDIIYDKSPENQHAGGWDPFDFPPPCEYLQLSHIPSEDTMEVVKPSVLPAGSLIGLVSPATTVSDLSRIEKAVRYLEGRGYRVAVGENVRKVHGYLAGTDEERAADLHAMFANKEVKAVMCIRGGYGTPRLLHLLNYRLIARNPKIFVGYSDITALQLAFWRKCRLITFQGPMPGVDFIDPVDPFSEEMFWRLVTSPRKAGRLALPGGTLTALRPGCASGRLLGGNLSLVIALMGTAYQPDFRDSILFLEDVEEEPYRLDRMLMQLRLAGVMDRCAGVLLGQFTDCVPRDPSKPTLTVDDILRETAAAGSVPFLTNAPFGHISVKLTMPLGIRSRIDAGAGTIEYSEAAVR